MDTAVMIKKIEESFVKYKQGDIYRSVIDTTEKILIEKALECSDGNKIAAAKILGLNRNTLHSKIKKLNINVEFYK